MGLLRGERLGDSTEKWPLMSLPSSEMEARLRAFYDRHNPGNTQNIEEIVRKYRGKEAALCAKLKKKYGEAPDLINDDEGQSPPAARGPAPPPARSVAYDPGYVVVRVEAAPSRGDPALDFGSTAFDALKALRTREAAPPITGLAPLDNIYKCRHLLPETDPNFQQLVAVSAKKPSTSGATAAKDKGAAPVQRAPLLFEALADTYLDGPFTVLRRCFLERKRVRVVMRRVNSVRGACSGFLKAFDKHMNMVLLDVTEQWIAPRFYEQHDRAKRLGGGRPDPATLFSVADSRRNRAFTEQSYAKQLFVRGDNVVMVMEDTRPPPERSSESRSRARAYEPRS